MNVGTHQVGMAQQGAARPAGNGGRVDNNQAVGGGHLPALERPVIVEKGAEMAVCRPGPPQIIYLFQRTQALPVGFKLRPEFGIHKQHLHRAVIEVEKHFLDRKPPVDRQYDRPQCGCCAVKHEIFQAVFADNPDAGPLCNAGLLQTGRQPIDCLLELGKSHRAPVIGLEPGGLFPVTGGIALDQVIKGKVIQCHQNQLPGLHATQPCLRPPSSAHGREQAGRHALSI